jgi:cation:H+ antiporter
MAVWGIHPASAVILIMYLIGLRLATQSRDLPAWQPVRTDETREDTPAPEDSGAGISPRLWLGFALSAMVVAVAGWMVGHAGIALVRLTGVSETLIGSLFTAVATSLPELVTTVAAVRQGALTLAVSGIIGGNTFDVLFLVLADTAYRDGSIYHAIGPAPLFLITLSILLTATLLLGLIQRQRHGVANIGFESIAVLGFYLSGMAVLAWWPGT